ncbi:MAG: hypothetical protein EP335_02240 [Alphaproteobacteria bacterium]|nr:MAG: hypothetical protein EP335_02240 [Alphaproteobacteria bacterium]
MSGTNPQPLHGTVVAIDDIGVLITGPSGAGKSDLALRLIDRGAKLVADDQVLLTAADGQLVAGPPERLAGFLEVRGIGIIPQAHTANVPLGLMVELVPSDTVERLPERTASRILDVPLLSMRLNAFEVSTPIKIELALRHPEWIASGGPDDRDDNNR